MGGELCKGSTSINLSLLRTCVLPNHKETNISPGTFNLQFDDISVHSFLSGRRRRHLHAFFHHQPNQPPTKLREPFRSGSVFVDYSGIFKRTYRTTPDYN